MANRGPVAARFGAQRAEKLLDMERDPVRSLEYGGHHIARGREPGVEDQRRDQARFGEGERSEANLFCHALPDEARPPRPEARRRLDLLRPIVGGQEERPIARLPGELTDDLEAQIVRPLEILEDEHRGARERREDPVDDAHDKPAPLDLLGGRRRIGQDQKLAAERFEGGQPGHRAGHVEERRGRDVAILGSHGAVDSVQAARLRLALDRSQEPRLADPGLAGEQDELAAAFEDVVEPPVGEDEQVVTPDEERTADGSRCGRHRSEV